MRSFVPITFPRFVGDQDAANAQIPRVKPPYLRKPPQYIITLLRSASAIFNVPSFISTMHV